MRKFYYEFEGIDLARKYFADHGSATHDAEETARIMLRQKMVQGNEIVANVYCEENALYEVRMSDNALDIKINQHLLNSN